MFQSHDESIVFALVCSVTQFLWQQVIRYVHQDNIKEEFLVCENLLTTTKEEDVFNIINSFFTKNVLDWNSVQQV